jgi:hypothetical protein
VSAPTALDGGALLGGLAWYVPPPRHERDASADIDSADERRSRARVAALTRTHDELCTQAVDPFEIAAGLEAAGVSDRQARAIYGAASVFELAEAMYHLVPRRPSDSSAPADTWHRPLSRHLLRGLLYGLPGLMYAVALSMLRAGSGALLLLLGATVVASGLGQGLSLLGHVLIGRGQRRAARTLFRSALIFGGLLLAMLIVTGWLSGSLLSTAVLAGCQVEYLLSATVLMVLNADLLLLAVLTPGVLLATAELTGWTAAIPGSVTLGLLALCLACAVVAAASQLAAGAAESGKHLRKGRSLRLGLGLGSVDRALGARYFVYGTVNAGLLSFAVVDVLAHPKDAAGGAIALMMLPVVASLGVAEWQAYRLRSRAVTALRQTTSATSFRARARAELVLAVLGYGAVVAALTGVVLIAAPGMPGPVFVLSICAYGVLGLALLLETLLLSLGRHGLALGLAATALAVDTALRWPLAAHPPEALAAMHLAVFTGLLLIVLPVAASQYCRMGAHR